ncbi:MAG: VWA domain-containing protein [Acidimicrobiales bacterium]|nr:VWA domain-containing protein [Acidimicrobiales bacterium]
MFRGVDRALFGASLAQKLIQAGVSVPLGAINRLISAMEAIHPVSKQQMYWVARVSLLVDHRDIPAFNRVFSSVFDITLEELKNPLGRRAVVPAPPKQSDDAYVSLRVAEAENETSGRSLPWATLPSVGEHLDDADDDGTMLPERLPSALTAESDIPFDLLDPNQLVAVERALAEAFNEWPLRHNRRLQNWKSGPTVQLRATLRSALRTGGEPVTVHFARQRSRPRRVVVLVDVSGSMQSFARPYLHLTRALVMAGRAEVFAFATDLTRITNSLKHRSPAEAIDRASDEVGDRFGGTRVANSLRELLTHRTWGSLVRGAIVVIASDGWDTDPPEELAAQMAKLSRRTHRIVWLNPRSGGADYQPLVASMAAALPYCNYFLPGHNLGAMPDVIAAITGQETSHSTRRPPSRARSLVGN